MPRRSQGLHPPPPPKDAVYDFVVVRAGEVVYHSSTPPVPKSAPPPRPPRKAWTAGHTATVLGRVGYTADEVSRVLEPAMAVADKLDGILPQTPAEWRPGTRREVVAAFRALAVVQGVDGGVGPALAAGRDLCEALRAKSPRPYAAALVLYGAMLSRAGRSAEAVAAFREAVAVVRPAAPEPVTSPPPQPG